MVHGDFKWEFSIAREPCPQSLGSHSPSWCQQPSRPELWHWSAVFLRDCGGGGSFPSPAGTSQGEQTELLSSSGIVQCQQERSKISPKGYLIAIGKKSCFFFPRKKRQVFHPFSFQRDAVSADSVSFRSKQAHSSFQKVPLK